MYLLQKDNKKIIPLTERDFSSMAIREREDIEEWVENEPSILGEELLVIQKEYSGFDDTNERLDLLSIDKNGNLVIIELKRDDSGKDVNWQAIKYAAYCSTLTNDDIFDIYAQYLIRKNNSEYNRSDAAEYISNFLDVETNDVNLNLNQRMILVSKEFRKEVLSTVMWLLDNNIDVKCVKIQPYENKENGNFFIVPTVILPPPDTEEYRIKKNTVRMEHEKVIKSRGNHYEFFAELKKAFIQKMGTDIPFSRRASEYFKIKTVFPVEHVHFEFLYPEDSSCIFVALHLEQKKEDAKKLLNSIFTKVPDWKEIPGIELDENWEYGIQLSIKHERNDEDEKDTIEWAVENMKILYETFNPVLENIKQEGY